ncbi:MAG: Omp28-related outer membrane protein [bacterium]
MKIFKNIFPALLPALLFLQSCDKLSSPYAEVRPSGGDTTSRAVLLEDYTGHKCVNCPLAAIMAHDLEKLYSGQVFVVAVHATYFATPDPSGDYTADYRTEAGTEWASFYEIESAPNGLVNRSFFAGKNIYMSPKLWGGAIEAAVELPKAAIMKINTSWDEGTRTLTSVIDTRFLMQMEGAFSLVACILEDSIVSPQQNKDTLAGPVPVIKDYVFMNMLRGTMKGPWGEQLTPAVDLNKVYRKEYTYQLPADWNKTHCWVLAFIYDDLNREIYHVVKSKATIDPE